MTQKTPRKMAGYIRRVKVATPAARDDIIGREEMTIESVELFGKFTRINGDVV